MEYLSIRQTVDKWDISIIRIQMLCTEGRIPGAMKIGFYWPFLLLPKNQITRESKVENYIKTKEQ